MSRAPFFAVRVVVTHADGGTATRDYVRHDRTGKERFTAWAVGDMIGLVTEPNDFFKVATFEIDFETVRQNRLYQHTTH